MNALGMIEIIGCGFMVLCGSAAFAADPQARLSIYKAEVLGKATGVYEIGDDLYVHVQMPTGKGGISPALKMKAVTKANNLLLHWALEYTKADRQKLGSLPVGFASIVNLLDDANPLWRFGDWKVKFSGQEHTGQDKTHFWLGQFVAKADIVAQIPESFRKAIPDERRVVSALKLMLPQMLDNSPKRVFEMCGVLDCGSIDVTNANLKVAYDETAKMLDDYLRSSAFVEHIRQNAISVNGPRVAETWTEGKFRTEAVTNVVVVSVTNRLVDVVVTTNSLIVAQSTQDKAEVGVSMGGRVRVETFESMPDEVVLTRTTTVMETCRVKRRRTVRRESGTARFEELFLSAAKLENMSEARTVIGSAAENAFLSDGFTVEEIERIVHDALCENPGDAGLWNLYGRLCYKKGDKLAALICYRNALKLDARHQYALVNIAVTYKDLGFGALSIGPAVLSLGLADNQWCIDRAIEILGLHLPVKQEAR